VFYFPQNAIDFIDLLFFFYKYFFRNRVLKSKYQPGQIKANFLKIGYFKPDTAGLASIFKFGAKIVFLEQGN
jgi:hypothetical protein